ncbi:MAG: response regulator [Tissierellaceae bacterium]|nr:response regulator [Tissierellaceae bacterium]
MILLIDDNKDLVNIISQYLNMVGYEARVALSGDEGIAHAKEQKPKIILCDIGMPGMNGHEVAKYIRQNDELKDIYLIAMSGYCSQTDVERSLEAGFDKHLSKPIDFKVIKELIDDRESINKLKSK